MRIFFLAIGIVAFVLGIAGVFLPLLPTTPFLLLATYCFSKGHPGLYRWITEHRFFGPPIRDWHRRHAIRPPMKAIALASMAIGLAVVWLKLPESYRLFQAATTGFMVAIALFILTRKSS